MKKKSAAIIGMACEFPGASGTDSFWDNLSKGIDSVLPVATDRFNAENYAPAFDDDTLEFLKNLRMGMVKDPYGIDEGLFKMGAEESLQTDPQQKMILKTVFHALEDAGLTTESLKALKVGVYIGASNIDNLWRVVGSPETINGHTNTGNTLSLLANRVSYALKAKGPSMTVDTACSSALTALHLGLEALRSGQCDVAIVGAVNLISSPLTNIGFHRLGVASKSGHCSFGSSAADGYVRGEGAGILILKRCDDATSAGDQVHATVVDCQISQGVGSGHIAAPSLKDQVSLLEKIYADNGISPAQLDYLEAHGTGTLHGDKIELSALAKGLKTGGRNKKLFVGSVKSNLGHLEPAAGIASLIKAVLMLKHRTIPASLHCETPREDFNFSKEMISVPMVKLEDNLRTIGVNAYGFGGSIAHAILVCAEDSLPVQDRKDSLLPFLISAESPASLRRNIEKLREFVAHTSPDLAELAHSLANKKNLHRHFSLTYAATKEALLENLSGPLLLERSKKTEGKTAFIFPGAGGKFIPSSNALALLDEEFKNRFQEIISSAGLAPDSFEDEKTISDIRTYQLGAYAFQVSLYELLCRFGLKVDVFVGHSMGEVSALVAAGRISWQTGLELVDRRARCLLAATGQGQMVWFPRSLGHLEKTLPVQRAHWQVAAVNAPESTVISFHTPISKELIEHFEAKIVQSFNVPAHSSAIDPAELSSFTCRPSTGQVVYSTRHTKPLTDLEISTAAYWKEQLVNPVLFSDTLKNMHDNGVRLFIDLGGMFASDLQSILKKDLRKVALIHDDFKEQQALRDCLGKIFQQGAQLQLERLLPEQVNFLRTPLYAWNETSRPLPEITYRHSSKKSSQIKSHVALLTTGWEAFTPKQLGSTPGQQTLTLDTPEVPAAPHYLLIVTPGHAPLAMVCCVRQILSHAPLSLTIQGTELGAVRSLIKCLRFEYPETKFTTVETDQLTCASELCVVTGSDCKKSAGLWYREVLKDHLQDKEQSSLQIPECALISGGLGSLGLQSAKWLASQGTKDIILLTRSAFPERKTWRTLLSSDHKLSAVIRGILEAERSGAKVQIAVGDVSSRGDLLRIKDELHCSMLPTPNLLIHAAGTLRDGLFKDLALEDFEAVLTPKLTGLKNLWEVFESKNLAKIISFSSLSQVMGSPGQSNYALANSLMAQACPGPRHVMLELGPFQSQGLAASAEASSWLDQVGIKQLEISDLSSFLAAGLGASPASLVCIHKESKRWLKEFFSQSEATESISTLNVLKDLLQDFRPDLEVDEAVPLSQYGLDSITAVGLRYKLSQKGLTPPALSYLLQGPSLIEISLAMNDQNKQVTQPVVQVLKASGNRTLVCFPFAGSNGYRFKKLLDSLPADVAVWTVERPATHAREGQREGYYQDVAAKLDQLTGEVMLFGYSLGTNIAFNVAGRMTRAPVSIVAASSRCVDDNWHFDKLAAASNEEVRDWIFNLGNIPDRNLIDDSMIEFFKKDLSWTSALKPTELLAFGGSLIWALRGSSDPVITGADLETWQTVFPQAAGLTLDGDHFFASKQAEKICEYLLRRNSKDLLLEGLRELLAHQAPKAQLIRSS
ncbi:MAG TPA: beta-ketoacyl synthase N-terminal-like domain-containing protein [Bacteriovoracaceae bacterium]|nr:beta-ketoacyl synthase N-terminal-like domain-containing protein [Bacteriovoracaceae bacterium]